MVMVAINNKHQVSEWERLEQIRSISTLDGLMNLAFCPCREAKIFWPGLNCSELLERSTKGYHNMHYSIRNNVIAFKYDYNFYLVPYLRKFHDILVGANFTDAKLYVPLSSEEQMLNDDTWFKLQQDIKAYQDAFQEN